jgi:Anaphase-promoting complex APC subunit CDC26
MALRRPPTRVELKAEDIEEYTKVRCRTPPRDDAMIVDDVVVRRVETWRVCSCDVAALT